MSAVKEPRTRDEDPAKASLFWKRANEYRESMHHSIGKEHWEAASGAAIHCMISASDAVMVALSGSRFAAPDHRGASTLLLEKAAKVADVEKAASRLDKALSIKSRVEYEGKKTTRKDAESLKTHADRFFDWAQSALPKEFRR